MLSLASDATKPPRVIAPLLSFLRSHLCSADHWYLLESHHWEQACRACSATALGVSQVVMIKDSLGFVEVALFQE